MCSFTYGHLTEVIRSASGVGCRFITFSESEGQFGPGLILLRHDVDHSLEAARRMAEFERRQGVRATYFILPHSSYNILSSQGITDLRVIRDCGHEVGLHYDVRFYDAVGWSLTEGIRRDIRMLEDLLECRVSFLSAHNPTTSRKVEAGELEGFRDAYLSTSGRGYRYISDSCQSWRDGCVCGQIHAHVMLHVLIHPIWWGEKAGDLFGILEAERLKRMREVRSICEADVAHYRYCLRERVALDSEDIRNRRTGD